MSSPGLKNSSPSFDIWIRVSQEEESQLQKCLHPWRGAGSAPSIDEGGGPPPLRGQTDGGGPPPLLDNAARRCPRGFLSDGGSGNSVTRKSFPRISPRHPSIARTAASRPCRCR